MVNYSISSTELESFCKSEGEPEQFELIEGLWKKVRKQKLSNMEAIESLVIEATVNNL